MNELQLQHYVQIVRKESSWGRKQSLYSYKEYIQYEYQELILAERLKDKTNIEEELADICMMLEFYKQELRELKSCSLGSRKLFRLNRRTRIRMSEHKELNYFSMLKKKIISIGKHYGFCVTDIYDRACTKLETRYPLLLPYQQLTIDGEFWEEEFEWEKRKRYYKMMEFCTCLNENCSNYLKAYNGENFSIVDGKIGQPYIICEFCKHRVAVTNTVLFYGSKQDYKIALRAVSEYRATGREVEVCEEYHLTPRILRSLSKKVSDNEELYENIIKSRYFYDE